MIVARYPDHVRRPLPWFERLKTLPSLDPPGSKERWIAFYERTRDALERDYPDRFLAFDVKAVCVRRADTPRTGRGDAGGRDADIPRRRFAAPPRLRAGHSFRRRADRGCELDIPFGDEPRRRRRGCLVDSPRGDDERTTARARSSRERKCRRIVSVRVDSATPRRGRSVETVARRRAGRRCSTFWASTTSRASRPRSRASTT